MSSSKSTRAPGARSGGAPACPGEGAGRVAFVHLGCPKNLVDGETMMARLAGDGFRLVTDFAEADLAVVNTCAFIADAQRESIDRILEAAAWKRRGRLRALLVAGCLAERHGAELLKEMPEVDGLLGPGRTDRIAVLSRALLAGRGPRVLLGGFDRARPLRQGTRLRTGFPHVAYVKIAEGCDHRCRFCLIPRLRGPQRSRAPEEILRELALLADEGVREAVLVAQDTTAYGRDLHPRTDFARLLARIEESPGPSWVRALYTHPNRWNDDLVRAYTRGERLLPYVDLPVQHASDRVLLAMGRGACGTRIRRLIERLRERVPGVVLRATILTGHPGEGEAEFEELLKFMRQFPFDRLGAFAYSPEPETGSAGMAERPPRRVALLRRARVLALQKEIALGLQRARIGRVCDVLVDGVHADGKRFLARSYGEAPDIDGVIRARIPARRPEEAAEPGQFRRVRIVAAGPYDLQAVAVGESEGWRSGPGPEPCRAWKEES